MWKEGTQRTLSHSGRYMTLCSSKRVLQTHTVPGEALWFYCLSFLSLCAGTLLPLSWILQAEVPVCDPRLAPVLFLKSSHDFSSTPTPIPRCHTKEGMSVRTWLQTHQRNPPSSTAFSSEWKYKGAGAGGGSYRDSERGSVPSADMVLWLPPSNLNRSVSQSLNSSGWQL